MIDKKTAFLIMSIVFLCAVNQSGALASGNVSGTSEVLAGVKNNPATSEVSTSPAAAADTAETAAVKAPSAVTAEAAFVNEGEALDKIKKIIELNKEIFFTEHLVAMRVSNENGNAENKLNGLYARREALSNELATAAFNDRSFKILKLIKTSILNIKLYEVAGFDSLVNRMLCVFAAPDPSDTVSVSLSPRDSILELKSYIKLEASRVENPITFEGELSGYINTASSKPGQAVSQQDASGPGGPAEFKYKKEAPFTEFELTPAGNSDDAAIDQPLVVKFGGDKFKNLPQNIDLKIKSVALKQKYATAASSLDSGKIDFKWDAANNSIAISHGAPLERNVIYGASVTFEHALPTAADKKSAETRVGAAPASGGKSGASSPAASASNTGVSGPSPAASSGAPSASALSRPSSEAASAPAPAPAVQPSAVPAPAEAPAGYARSRTVESGVFKTVDIDFAEKKVEYKFDWAFQTMAYASTTSVALEKPAETSENGLDKKTGEVSLKDARDTGENQLKKPLPGATGENSLKKEPPFPTFEKDAELPVIVLREPEGPATKKSSDIFVVFSCEMDPRSVKGDTMQLFIETSKGIFSMVTGEAELVGRKLQFRPFSGLEHGKNYKVTVNNIKSATGIMIPVAESYFFKTAPGVVAVKLPHDGSVAIDGTFEITLSEPITDVKLKFINCDDTRESELEIDVYSRLFKERQDGSQIGKIALNPTGSAILPAPVKTASGDAPVESKIVKQSQESGKGLYTIYFKPKKQLKKGQAYKIDVYSDSKYIDNNIIKFKAK